MRLIWCCSALLLLLIPRACRGGNILVFPIEGSHWVNMDILIQALHERGHSITIVRSSKSWYIKENSSYYDTFTVEVERAFDQKAITELITDIIAYERGALPIMHVLHMTVGMFSKFMDIHKCISALVSTMLSDQELTRTMKDNKYDMVLTDPGWGGGVILANYLNIPLVYNVRWLLSGEGHLAVAPSPLSYIPMTGSGYTDQMSFFQRVANVALYLVTQVHNYMAMTQIYQPICDKYLGPGNSYDYLVANADLWLMRVDFVFEFPRPTMPNVVYMGGFQCKPAKPLPEHLEEFVQSSGEHGVIIMSMGTFVSELPAAVTDKMATAFAELPQKVIWKHAGARPATLGNNTLLVDWMPQNDLLGHPKMKLFITHGGTNSVQEAIYHGVPVVGLPLFFDQYDNLLRLREKGGAKLLTIKTVDQEDNFPEAVQEVLSKPSYRMNMQRLSRLHRDQPMKPLDNALFWVEFVMRHKGAAHLKAACYRMPWYSYYSVDVLLFLTGAVLLVLLTLSILIRWLYNAVCKRKVKHD